MWLLVFFTIGIAGGIGSLLGGWASGRFERGRAASVAMVISAICSLVSLLVFDTPWPVVVLLLSVWGASVIADSASFSTAIREVADARYSGTALTVQTAVGFLVTLVTISVVPVAAELIGWQYAFLILALGPLVGAIAMRSYRQHIEVS